MGGLTPQTPLGYATEWYNINLSANMIQQFNNPS